MSLRGNLNNVLRVGIGAVLFLIPATCLGETSETEQQKPAESQTQPTEVVTIEPRCPVEPPRAAKPGERSATVPVRVRYNPAAPGAKFTKPESLTISLAINASYYANSHRTLAMSRTGDGAWETTIPLEAYWSFLIFFVKDQNDRIDSNQGDYWQILSCGADATPTSMATYYLAASYAGDVLAPGIQRAVDYARAISILEDDRKRHPDRIGSASEVWRYQMKQAGETDAAYAKLAGEIEQFIVDQKDNEAALTAALRFVSNSTWKRRLPVSLFDKAQTALLTLNPKSPIIGELKWDQIREEKDLQRRATLYREFLQSYPQHDYTQSAYAQLFETLAYQIKDEAAAEKAFADWRGFEPGVADVLAAMGRFYVDQKTKPERAVELLTKAIELCQGQVKNPIRRSGITRRIMVGCAAPDPGNPAAGQAALDREFAQLRYYRGLAQAQRGELAASIEDLEFAARVMNESTKVALKLGEVYEKAGRKKAAYTAYLEAATAPQQTSREPTAALERVFLSGKMGTRAELDRRIVSRSRERRAKAAAEFKPVPLDRPTPTFEFTTLKGQKVDNAALRGRPVVLTFWADWCGPCAAEMPGFLDFQRRNPNVTVIGVAVMSELKNVQEIIQKRKWDMLTMAQSDVTGNGFGVTAVPQTYVIDKDGRLRFVHRGELPDVVAMLEKELALLSAK
jgi:thiol-disulfide isomerase/thioredoxin/Tfp pilus assembly protein PilF